MCLSSSSNIGWRLAFLSLALFFWCSTSATSLPEESPSDAPSSVSSSDFFQAVQELRDFLKDQPQDKALTLVLTYYSDRERQKNRSIGKLSISWEKEKAKIQSDGLVLAVASGGAGFIAGLLTPHR